jgi:hypothetical protein
MSSIFTGLVGFPLARSGLPRRDDPDLQPAPGIGHHEDLPRGTGSDRDEPPLIRVFVFHRNAALVGEDGGRLGEIDAVFPEVLGGFTRTPLILVDCMHARTLRQGATAIQFPGGVTAVLRNQRSLSKNGNSLIYEREKTSSAHIEIEPLRNSVLSRWALTRTG